MKLRLTLLLWALLAACLHAFSINEIESDPIPVSTKEVVYDTLQNIRIHPDPKDYERYIGQSILFYPRHPESTSEVKYYGNFRILTRTSSLSLFDNVRKDRKKAAASGSIGNNGKDNIYKPEFVTNGKVFYPSADRRGTFEGFYTPYQEIEGKIFRIVDVKKREADFMAGDPWFYFDLESEEGVQIRWTVNANYPFPCVIVSYYEKMKEKYVGKTFRISNMYEGKNALRNPDRGGKFDFVKGKLKCVDLRLEGNEQTFLTPHLVFETEDKETRIMELIPLLRINYLEGNRTVKSELGTRVSGNQMVETELYATGYCPELEDLIPEGTE